MISPVKESFSFLSVISVLSVVDKFIADKLKLKEIDQLVISFRYTTWYKSSLDLSV